MGLPVIVPAFVRCVDDLLGFSIRIRQFLYARGNVRFGIRSFHVVRGTVGVGYPDLGARDSDGSMVRYRWKGLAGGIRAWVLYTDNVDNAMLKKDINKLDDIWALLVKDKAKWKCEHCGIRGMRMEAAHVAGRRHRATRWGCFFDGVFDLCGHCLCHNCHQQYDEHGPLENSIIEHTVGLDRKIKIQARALEFVAKQQFFEDIKKILEDYGNQN